MSLEFFTTWFLDVFTLWVGAHGVIGALAALANFETGMSLPERNDLVLEKYMARRQIVENNVHLLYEFGFSIQEGWEGTMEISKRLMDHAKE